MSQMKLGIIGGGVVGSAVARAFMEYAEVRVYDKDSRRSTHGLDEVLKCDLVHVCLPSPQKEDTLECDLSYINSFFSLMYERGHTSTNFVLRSTVPIGTTRKLRERFGFTNLIHSPEFLTARCSFTDAQIPSRNIVGGEPCDCFYNLKQLYEDRFPGTTTYCMSSDESEAVKNFLNAFFAVKVSFFNEINEFATKAGLRWKKIIEGLLSDGRIAQSHYKVPGPDGSFGYGGACLPKDIASLISQMCDVGLEPTMCLASHRRNAHDRERKV